VPKLIDPAPREWNLDAFIIESLREGVPEIATDALVRASIVLPFAFSPVRDGGTSGTRRICSALSWTNSASSFPTPITRSRTWPVVLRAKSWRDVWVTHQAGTRTRITQFVVASTGPPW